MADHVDKKQRSKIMSLVRSSNTKPELAVRKALYAQGVRYRLYCIDLPGRPDLLLKKFNAVIFIHGCLWHWHGCARSRMPSTNHLYWQKKIDKNKDRDHENEMKLIHAGWRVLIIWECAIKKTLLEQTISLTKSWILNNELRYCKIEPLNKKEVLLIDLNKLSDYDS